MKGLLTVTKRLREALGGVWIGMYNKRIVIHYNRGSHEVSI